jgi:hypothetical protein
VARILRRADRSPKKKENSVIDRVGPDEYNSEPTDEMKRAIHKVRTAVTIMRETILKDVPDGRSRSLALTNLDQMRMWALEAITHA